jgi:Glyoxalase/Bleomycin resistance protein/Dioxygenase superfamily
MARIRHIAIYTENPNDTAAFYCKAFDLKEVKRSPRGAIYLSDGYINIALLVPRSDSTLKGIHHFGFQVDTSRKPRTGLKRSNRTSKSSNLPRESLLPNIRSKTRREIFLISPKRVGKFNFFNVNY